MGLDPTTHTQTAFTASHILMSLRP